MVKILKIVIPILLIIAGFLGVSWMMNNKIEAQKAVVEEATTLVEIEDLQPVTKQIVISAQGSVTAAKQVVINPQVGGKLISINKNLVPGGLFRKGEIMARIDPKDYEFAVEAQKERIANALYLLKLEKGQQEVAKQEWDLLKDSIQTTEQGRELALREPQIEKAEASLKSAKSGLEKSELDLSRTTISIPFNALVINENVDIGQLVGPNVPMATLVGTDQYWVQVSIPMDDLVWINIPGVGGNNGSNTEIIQSSGAVSVTRDGAVVRLLGDLDRAGRMARLLVAVDDPLLLKKGAEGEVPMLLGSYVGVNIFGKEVENVFEIPRSAIREASDVVAGEGVTAGYVWIVDADSRLEIREVKVLHRLERTVLISEGLEAGEKIILSSIINPLANMKVEITNGSN